MEAGNITKAAEQLHIAQTALGLQIRNLEEDLQVALLNRHSRGIEPTDAGKLLYRRAIDLLQAIQEARRDVKALGKDIPEEVRIGIPPSMLRLIGLDLVIAAAAELPQLSLRFIEDLSFNLIDALGRGELDIALAFEVPDTPGLTKTAVSDEELIFIEAPDNGSEGTQIGFHEVAQSNLALASDRGSVWTLLQQASAEISIDISPQYWVQSTDAIKKIVSKGVASSVVAYGVAVDDIFRGSVQARPITNPVLRRTLYVVRPAGGPRFANDGRLIDFLLRAVQLLVVACQPYSRLIDQSAGIRTDEALPIRNAS